MPRYDVTIGVVRAEDVSTNRLDRLLGYIESHRPTVLVIAGIMIWLIAWGDWMVPEVSIGRLYLLPILLSAAALRGAQIVALSVLCGYLREAFDPLEMVAAKPGTYPPFFLNPLHWVPGASERLLVSAVVFAMAGFFVAELNQRRRLLTEHLKEREQQILLRQEAELQVRILIETSPLAILTLNGDGRVVLANESARELLDFGEESLQGCQVEQYLPTLYRMLGPHRSGGNIRTNVECRGQRRNGEVFLAHVWLSTYHTLNGPGLAAVVWDFSENLRDREGAGLDSMMATSRVLIGAISHEVRNLASAAASAYAKLGETCDLGQSEQYQVLGTLVQGLEKIASSGLRVASSQEVAAADLDTVLDEARVVIEPSLREADIAVTWDVAPDLPLVQADHHSLLQVFVNLARNCRQVLEDCEHRKVRISAGLEKDLVVVRFHDSGPGVERPEELFRPFHSGAQSTGLGLYISRAILRSYGGGLRYEPKIGGSCFAVELWPVENALEGRDLGVQR